MSDLFPTPERSTLIAFPGNELPLKSGDGGGTVDGMEARISKLEAQFDTINSRFDGLDRRLDRIEDKIPSKWDMAQVVFFVMGSLMAAAIFGPRILAAIQSNSM